MERTGVARQTSDSLSREKTNMQNGKRGYEKMSTKNSIISIKEQIDLLEMLLPTLKQPIEIAKAVGELQGLMFAISIITMEDLPCKH